MVPIILHVFPNGTHNSAIMMARPRTFKHVKEPPELRIRSIARSLPTNGFREVQGHGLQALHLCYQKGTTHQSLSPNSVRVAVRIHSGSAPDFDPIAAQTFPLPYKNSPIFKTATSDITYPAFLSCRFFIDKGERANMKQEGCNPPVLPRSGVVLSK